MKQFFAVPLVLLLAAPSLPAQEEEPGEGRSLMEKGAELFLRGLRQEIDPALEGFQGFADEFGPAMRGFFQEMGPALGDLMERVEDWSMYHPPEFMPNGDIIIRRKDDAPAFETEPGEAIDL